MTATTQQHIEELSKGACGPKDKAIKMMQRIDIRFGI